MKFFFILLSILTAIPAAEGQETIEVTYDRMQVESGVSLFDIVQTKGKLKANSKSVMRNDTTFEFPIFYNKIAFKNGVYAGKLVHHSTYFVNTDSNFYSTVNLRGDKYFIHTQEKDNWKFQWMDTTKSILGYECQAALAVNSSGDSSTMWVAKNVSPDIVSSHAGYIVPGIVMESLNLKYGIYYKAVKVEKTNNTIYFPKDLPMYSLEEHKEKSKLNPYVPVPITTITVNGRSRRMNGF